MKTLLRYAGGKSKAIDYITPYVAEYDKIVSPFLGGGSLEVNWASKGKIVEGYDIFDILVNFWNVLLNDNHTLANELSMISPTAEAYIDIKEKLMCTPQVQQMLKDWKTNFYYRQQDSLLDERLAAYYFFNHNCSYGPGFLGWASKIYLDQNKWNNTIEKVKSFKCPNLSVKQSTFDSVIENNKSEFLYLDPPYYLEKDRDNKMFAGIYPMRNIPVHHNTFDHEKLRDLLLNHKGDFVLSYNDCETIRDWYSDFEFHFPKWHYSMSLGETRIGKNRKTTDNTKKESHEILIVKRPHLKSV
jgi:DNA adenine methylase